MRCVALHVQYVLLRGARMIRWLKGSHFFSAHPTTHPLYVPLFRISFPFASLPLWQEDWSARHKKICPKAKERRDLTARAGSFVQMFASGMR